MKHAKGFGILEAVFASLIALGVGVLLMRLFSTTLRIQRHVVQTNLKEGIQTNVDAILRNSLSCFHSIGPLDPTITTPQPLMLRDAAGNDVITAGTQMEGIRAASINARFLQVTGPVRQLVVEMELQKVDTKPTMRDSWKYARFINARVSGLAVSGCVLEEGGIIKIEELQNTLIAGRDAFHFVVGAGPDSFDATTQVTTIQRNLQDSCPLTQADRAFGCFGVDYLPVNVTAQGSYLSIQGAGSLGAFFADPTPSFGATLSFTLTCPSGTQRKAINHVATNGGHPISTWGNSVPVGAPTAPGDVCTIRSRVGWGYNPSQTAPASAAPIPNPDISSWLTFFSVTHYR